jgi:hypothetical protein
MKPALAAAALAAACGPADSSQPGGIAGGDWTGAAQARVAARPGVVEAWWPTSTYNQFWVTLAPGDAAPAALAQSLCEDFAAAGMPAGHLLRLRLLDDGPAGGRLLHQALCRVAPGGAAETEAEPAR